MNTFAPAPSRTPAPRPAEPAKRATAPKAEADGRVPMYGAGHSLAALLPPPPADPTRREASRPEAPVAQRQAEARGGAAPGAGAAAPSAEPPRRWLERPSERSAARRPPNRTGLPDRLKANVEAMSGLSMDDVRVHRNSPKPAQLQALAYARGTEIHLGPGQERHLPHEAWHVVQQKQGRVRPMLQLKGVAIADNKELERDAQSAGFRLANEPSNDHRHMSAYPTPRSRPAAAPSTAPVQRIKEAASLEPNKLNVVGEVHPNVSLQRRHAEEELTKRHIPGGTYSREREFFILNELLGSGNRMYGDSSNNLVRYAASEITRNLSDAERSNTDPLIDHLLRINGLLISKETMNGLEKNIRGTMKNLPERREITEDRPPFEMKELESLFKTLETSRKLIAEAEDVHRAFGEDYKKRLGAENAEWKPPSQDKMETMVGDQNKSKRERSVLLLQINLVINKLLSVEAELPFDNNLSNDLYRPVLLAEADIKKNVECLRGLLSGNDKDKDLERIHRLLLSLDNMTCHAAIAAKEALKYSQEVAAEKQKWFDDNLSAKRSARMGTVAQKNQNRKVGMWKIGDKHVNDLLGENNANDTKSSDMNADAFALLREKKFESKYLEEIRELEKQAPKT